MLSSISHGRHPAVLLLPLALFAWMVVLPAPAAAITSQIDLLLDLDDDPGTGCTVSTVAGPFPGVEQVLTTVVETGGGGGFVDSVERSECVGAAFGPPTPVDPGDWPVGIGLGLDGSDVVETFLPLAGVAGDPRIIRIGVVTTGPSGEDALLETAAGGPIRLDLRTLLEIPTLSEWGLILFVLLLMAAAGRLLGARRTAAFVLVVALVGGGALAYAACVLDGQIDDWMPGDLLAEGTGSNGPGPDVEGVFGKEDAGAFCFRVDADLPKNDPPNARDDAFTTPEDTQLAGDVTADNGSGADSDPNGDPLSVDPTPVSGPTDGTLVLGTDGTFTYDPDPDFNGTDSFDYRLTDGQGGEDTATVTITVDPVNDGPTADPTAETTAEDTPVVVQLSGSDPEGDPLTFAIAAGPSDGSLGVITPTGPTTAEVTYTPNADFTGSDSFTYTANDGTDTSAPALASVTVTPENDPPVADDRAGSTTEDVATTFVLTGSDVDGDDLTFSIVTGPTKGTLGAVTQTGLTTAEVEYTPDPDTNGPDSFTYKANDGTVDSNVATFSITVDPDADAPVADDGAETTLEDTLVTITLSGSDPDGDSLTFSIDTPPANGSLSAITSTGATTATVDYTPDPDFNGADSFTFKANDGTTDSGAATVAIDVTPVNDPPSFDLPATPDQSVPEDSPAQTVNGFATSISPGPADESGQAVGFTVTNDDNSLFSAQPAIDAAGNLTYTPAPDANGTATVTVVAVDDGGTANGGVDTSAPQTFDLTITPVDDPPTAVDDTATVAEDAPATAIDVLANDTDIDGGPKLITGFTDPAGGTVTVTGGNTGLTYQPKANFCNDGTPTDDFQYTITGGDSATVRVTVNCVNDPPVADDETITAACNLEHVVEAAAGEAAAASAPIFRTIADNVLAGDSDPVEGTAVTIISATGTTTDSTGPTFDITTNEGGSVTLHSDGSFTYTPEGGDRSVADGFTYTIEDADGAQDVGTVTLNVGSTCVWFVDNSTGADDTGSGTSSDPFTSLVDEIGPDADPDDAEDASAATDVIYVFEGDSNGGDPYEGDFAPDDGQKLLGQGVDLVVDFGSGPETLFTGNPANRPLIADPDGDAVTVTAGTGSDRTGVEIRGFRLDAFDDGVEVTSTGSGAIGVLVSDNFFVDAGGEAIDANPGSSAPFGLTVEDNGYATASTGANGIDLVSSGAGTVTVAIDGNTDVTSATGTGINVEKAGAGDVFVTSFAGNSVHGNNAGIGIRVVGAVFDADTGTAGFQQVAGGNTAVGRFDNRVGGSAMVLTNVSGDLAFGDLDLFTEGAGATGLDLTGSGVFNGGAGTGFRLGLTGGDVSSTNGPALDLDPATVNATFGAVESLSSPTHGIRLKDIDGTINIPKGALPITSKIAAAAGTSFEVDGGNASIFFDGPIDNFAATTSLAVDIKNRPATAGDITLADDIGPFGPNKALGISITNNLAGVFTFSGRVWLETGASPAVTATGNSTPGTLVKFNGGLEIDTTTGTGFVATGGGTIEVCPDEGCGAGLGVLNRIDVGAGAPHALDLNGVNVGFAGVTFDTIKAGGATTGEGLDIDAVGSAGAAGFTVTGETKIPGTGAGAAGIDIAGSSATFTFDSIDIDATGGAGVRLTNNTGIVTISGGAIDGPVGTAFDVNQGGANVTYAGTIANTVGKSVEVTDRTGGTVTLSGNISHGPANALGIDVNTNSGGSTVFSGGSKAIDSGTANAIKLATNGGHTIRFTNGGLDVDTTSGEGFQAIGGGTVEVSGSGNTIDTGTGRGVNIANTTIDAADVTFERVSVDGATNGILLDSTGTAGGFVITGIDGPCGNTGSPLDCDGGTIQNTTADAIVLNDTQGVDLSFLRVTTIGNMAGGNDTLSGHDGIDATDVDGLTLTSVTFDTLSDSAVKALRLDGLTIENSAFEDANRYHLAGIADGTGAPEAMLYLRELGGTNTIDNSTFEDAAEHVDIENELVDLTLLTVQRSSFGATWKNTGAARLGKIGIDVVTKAGADATVHIGDPAESNAALGNSFLDARIASLRLAHFDESSTGRIDAIVSRNEFAVSHDVPAIFDFACTADQPQGGVILRTFGTPAARLDAIVSHNTFDHLQNADGRDGSLSILFDDAPGGGLGGVGQVRVTNNSFLFPYGSAFEVADDGATKGVAFFDANTITGGPVTKPACFIGFPAPAQAIDVFDQGAGGNLQVVVQNMTIPTHDTGFDPGASLRFLRNNAGTHCVAVSNVDAAEGFQLAQFAGTFNLEQGASAVTTPISTVMANNGNTGSVTTTGTINVVGPQNTEVCDRPSGAIFP